MSLNEMVWYYYRKGANQHSQVAYAFAEIMEQYLFSNLKFFLEPDQVDEFKGWLLMYGKECEYIVWDPIFSLSTDGVTAQLDRDGGLGVFISLSSQDSRHF